MIQRHFSRILFKMFKLFWSLYSQFKQMIISFMKSSQQQNRSFLFISFSS